jgi:hypothetical protein
MDDRVFAGEAGPDGKLAPDEQGLADVETDREGQLVVVARLPVDEHVGAHPDRPQVRQLVGDEVLDVRGMDIRGVVIARDVLPVLER